MVPNDSQAWPHVARKNKPMGQSVILCLDLGATTGWALHKSDGSIVSGSASFKPSRFEGGGMRYLKFNQWLNQFKDGLVAIDEVYFEEVRRHLGVDAAHAYGGFLAVLTAWCEGGNKTPVPYKGVPVGTIKKFISGKGNANKEEVIASVEELGHAPGDDNEADAIALLYFILSLQ